MKIDKNISDMNRIPAVIKYLSVFCIAVMLFPLQNARAVTPQDKTTVKGVVRDAHTNKPVVAAQISILNSSQTTTTDDRGAFRIEVPSDKALLHVTAYDYNVAEVPLQGKDSVVINLYPENFSNYYKTFENINGIVSNSTSVNSAVSIGNESLASAFTADEALQTGAGGNVRAISRSAVTGEGYSLFIRGLNSINANAQPLFVVDGVVWNNMYDVTSIHQGYSTNPLNNIESNDIQSITVIKDGTSLYGSKGSNGVVLINTKRGAGMATKINLNIVTGMTMAPKSIPVMGVNDYKIYATDMLGSAGLTNSQILQLPFLNDDPARSTYKLYHNNTNWADEVYRTAISKSYSINVQGGDEKALYYFSLGYTGNDEVVKGSDFQRYNMRLNGDIKLSGKINMGVNVGFARIDRKLVDDGVNNYTSPTWLSLIKAPFLSPNTFTYTGERTTEFAYTDIFGIGNPPAIINFANNTIKQNNFNVGLKPVIKISKELTFTEDFDYSLNKINEDTYRPYLFAAPIYIEGIGNSYNNRQSQVMRNTTVFSDARLSYQKRIDDKTLFSAFIGSRFIANNFESDFVEGHNSLTNSSINLVGGFKNLYTDGVNDITKSLSNYINIDYNYDNRLMLNLTTSMDASSRFGNQTKGGVSILGQTFGIFPAINGAWLVSSQKFMRHVPFISLLKLRAGLGITGNDDIKSYQTLAYFSSVRLKGVANGLVISSLANPTIQWETTARINLGMDLGLLNDRLTLTADVYSAATDNLLVLKQYQDIVGLGSYWTNSGMLSNRGFELSLNAKVLNLKDFRWELGVSAGHYVNEILELPNGSFTTKVYDGEILSSVGNSAGVFYGYKTNGVFASEAQATASNLKMLNSKGTYSYFGAGDVVFVDVNGDGIIDDKDKTVIGNPNPTLYGTANSKFVYKNLSLSALFTYSYGNDVYNYQRSQLESGKDFSNQSTVMLSRWTSENQVTAQPKAVYGDPMGNSRFSDRWIEDGSYIRLKSLTLTYSLPIKSSFIEGFSVWVSANNLLTLTNYLGSDPEFSAGNSVLFQGVDAGLLPFSKSYNVGLKFNL